MRSLLALLLLYGCASTGVDRDLATQVRAIADSQARDGKFTGVVIVAHGRQRLVEVAKGTTLDTRFNIASLGKMFTGVAIAQLVESGRLAYDKPIGAYLPSFPNADIAGRVTLQQLLTHTSGVPDLPDEIFNAPPASLAGYLPFFSQAKLQFEPGAQREYSNAGFVLLGMIIEAASGEPYAQYVTRHVFAPAKMNTVVGLPHGGAHATADDLVRFFDALRNGRLLKNTTLATEAGYGFGTLAFDTDRLVGHSGGDTGVSADAYTYWQSGYTIVVLSNMGPPASHDVARAIRKLLEPRFQKVSA